jgi:adenine-specific DNA-methyltransferase
MPKARLRLQTTTLWSYPSQHYDERHEAGHRDYRGATPDYILWNLLSRYTRPGDLVVDPMCGSGTTMVVARELGRRALGYDIRPAHPDVFRADARRLPLEPQKADFVFVDPPYSDHIRYSGLPECVGELSAYGPEYFPAMAQVISEIARVLRPERYAALYVHDTFEKGRGFVPIGFRLCSLFEQQQLLIVDAICVVRNNRTLLRNHFHFAAAEHNYYLRGFGHLLVFYKPSARNPLPVDRRDPKERAQQVADFEVHRESGPHEDLDLEEEEARREDQASREDRATRREQPAHGRSPARGDVPPKRAPSPRWEQPAHQQAAPRGNARRSGPLPPKQAPKPGASPKRPDRRR